MTKAAGIGMGALIVGAVLTVYYWLVFPSAHGAEAGAEMDRLVGAVVSVGVTLTGVGLLILDRLWAISRER